MRNRSTRGQEAASTDWRETAEDYFVGSKPPKSDIDQAREFLASWDEHNRLEKHLGIFEAIYNIARGAQARGLGGRDLRPAVHDALESYDPDGFDEVGPFSDERPGLSFELGEYLGFRTRGYLSPENEEARRLGEALQKGRIRRIEMICELQIESIEEQLWGYRISFLEAIGFKSSWVEQWRGRND